MAGHNEAVVTMTIDNQTEGAKITAEFINQLYPDMQDAQQVAALRDLLRGGVFLAILAREPGLTWAQAMNLVDANVTPTH